MKKFILFLLIGILFSGLVIAETYRGSQAVSFDGEPIVFLENSNFLAEMGFNSDLIWTVIAVVLFLVILYILFRKHKVVSNKKQIVSKKKKF